MTETEWLAATDPDPMCQYLEETHLAQRKPRLLAVAWCVRFSHQPPESSLEDALSVAEGFADEQVGRDDLHLARREVAGLVDEYDGGIPVFYHAALAALAATSDRSDVPHAFRLTDVSRGLANAAGFAAEDDAAALRDRKALKKLADAAEEVERRTLAELVREVFGNPFRPISFSLDWRTDTAVILSRQMYESRDFSAMPILADALQEAGCDNADILDHCRQPGEHVRGCWLVDLILGKS